MKVTLDNVDLGKYVGVVAAAALYKSEIIGPRWNGTTQAKQRWHQWVNITEAGKGV